MRSCRCFLFLLACIFLTQLHAGEMTPFWRSIPVDSTMPYQPFAWEVEQGDGANKWVWRIDDSDGVVLVRSSLQENAASSDATNGADIKTFTSELLPRSPLGILPMGVTGLLIFDRSSPTVVSFNTVTQQFAIQGELPFIPSEGSCGWNGRQVIFQPEHGPACGAELVQPVHFGWFNYAVLLIYMLGMVALGFIFVGGNSNASEFFHGGGNIPWWAAGISIFATMLSSITFLAMPSKAFATDWNMIFFNFGVVAVAPFVILFYLPRFRKYGTVSAYEYLENRFNSATRFFASGLFSLFMVTRIAVVLYLPAIALSLVTGIDIFTCILVAGLVTILYSTMGGVKAVIWGDVIQGLILTGGACLALVWLYLHTKGGVVGSLQTAYACGKLKTFNFSFDLTQPVFWTVLIGGIVSQLITYTSDQTILQRYLTTSDEKRAARSIWVNVVMVVPITLIFFLTGAALFSYYHCSPDRLTPALAPLDAIFPYYIVSELPVGISGLLIAAVFAASMSTLSANMNSASAALCNDFVKRMRPNLSPAQEVKIARWLGVIVGLLGVGIACILASTNIYSLWDQFNSFLGLLTGTLGAFFFIGFFLKRLKGASALIGAIGSILILLVIKSTTNLSFLLYGFIEIVLCCLIAWIVSLFSPQKEVQ